MNGVRCVDKAILFLECNDDIKDYLYYYISEHRVVN